MNVNYKCKRHITVQYNDDCVLIVKRPQEKYSLQLTMECSHALICE